MTPAFAQKLLQFGDALALYDAQGATRSYRQLAAAADEFGAPMVGTSGFVLIECHNTIATVTAIMAAWRAGLPVLLTKADDAESRARLIEAFRPAWLVRDTDRIATLVHAADNPAAVHPDLALLLSTSGTTGATKLVRLSARNVDANARSIADYLTIHATDRAITSLPLHYSYGLSVLNSHLAAGAALVLTDQSIIDPAFRTLCETAGVTSIAGVPHSYDLLERSGFMNWAPASVRTMTQAGGRLPADVAARFGAWMEQRGGRLFVMYGQTEATARMAFVDPAVLLDKPSIIGKPIPGGSFALLDDDGRPVAGPDRAGELVYRGPNVMMGYAERADDLARGAELSELRTGDLAMVDSDGDYRLIGRKQRFVKPFGLRVSLDAVEEYLASDGVAAMVTGDDGLIAVAVRGDIDPDAIRGKLALWLKLPENLFDVVAVSEFPLLDSGKRDYRRLLGDAQARQAVVSTVGAFSFLDLFRAAFPRKQVENHDSFISLSGDSLNYVLIASEIEERLGVLPDDWEASTIAELDALVGNEPASERSGWARIDSEIALRAAAITAVVVNHASDWPVGGGVDALFMLVGYNLARFHFGAFTGGAFWSVVVRFVPRILLPYYALMLVYALAGRPVAVESWLLISNVSGRFGSVLEPYWFIEAFFQCLLIVALISSIGPVRRWAESGSFRFAIGLLGVALLVKSVTPQIIDESQLWGRSPDQVFVLLALGWAISMARSRGQRALLMAVAAAFAIAQLSIESSAYRPFVGSGLRGVWILVAAVLLLYVRRIVVLPWLRMLLVTVSAASFTIYLLHNIVIFGVNTVFPMVPPFAVIVTAIVAGVVLHSVIGYLWKNFHLAQSGKTAAA